MTDESDAKVSRRYRELGAEEPPRALDEAILAASRRPARSWTQRWAVPLSLAAVLVLSVTVTLRIQHEQPGIELPVTAPKEVAPALPVPVRDAPLKLKAENRLNAGIAHSERDRQEKTVMRDEPKPIASERREQARPAAAAPEAAPAPAPAPAPVEALSSRSDVLRGAESSAAGSMARQVEERTGIRRDEPDAVEGSRSAPMASRTCM